jgi:hypothetical protein
MLKKINQFCHCLCVACIYERQREHCETDDYAHRNHCDIALVLHLSLRFRVTFSRKYRRQIRWQFSLLRFLLICVEAKTMPLRIAKARPSRWVQRRCPLWVKSRHSSAVV